MDLQTIISQLQGKFGNSLDIAKVTSILGGLDLKNLSMDEIIEKVKGSGIIGDLDGDGVQESIVEEIKGKLGNLFSGKK